VQRFRAPPADSNSIFKIAALTGYDELARVTAEVLNKARQQHELNPYATYTTFQNSVPQLFADVDRVKAKRQAVPLSNVFDTLQAYLGYGLHQ